MKTNRKALLTSVISLLICVTMLIGTTFAWFTDTASTSVSRIQAGTLKVQLWSANVTNGRVGESKNVGDITDETREPIFSAGTDESPILWEPGYTAYRVITIKNTGNLAFEFALDVTREAGATPTNLPEAIDAYYTVVETAPTEIATGAYSTWNCEPTPLSDIIDSTDEDGVVYGRILPANSTATPVAADFESKGEITVILALHMKETAGNEYMNKTEKFDIKVYAKQWTEEYDSNNNTYDANATYDETRVTPEPEEPACEHANKTVKHNADGTHSHYCPDCETTLDEAVTDEYTLRYSYNEDIHGTHTVTCTCGNMTPSTEACEPSTGTCAKCNNHTHNESTYTYNHINGTNEHKVIYLCCNNVKTESEACVDNDNNKKCDLCGSDLNIAPASATVTVNTNTPGLSSVTYNLMSGNTPVASAVADTDGIVSFNLDNLTETTSYTVVPSASDVTFTENYPTVTVTVTYDNKNLKYTADAYEADYVSGYTKTVLADDFEGYEINQKPSYLLDNYSGDSYSVQSYGENKVLKMYGRWNQWSTIEVPVNLKIYENLNATIGVTMNVRTTNQVINPKDEYANQDGYITYFSPTDKVVLKYGFGHWEVTGDKTRHEWSLHVDKQNGEASETDYNWQILSTGDNIAVDFSIYNTTNPKTGESIPEDQKPYTIRIGVETPYTSVKVFGDGSHYNYVPGDVYIDDIVVTVTVPTPIN